MNTANPKVYSSFNGKPTIFVAPDKAWSIENGKWTEVDSTDVLINAAVMSAAEFKARFGELPAPPN